MIMPHGLPRATCISGTCTMYGVRPSHARPGIPHRRVGGDRSAGDVAASAFRAADPTGEVPVVRPGGGWDAPEAAPLRAPGVRVHRAGSAAVELPR